MKKALYRLESYYKQNATAGEKRVLLYILNHEREVVDLDIHTLAKQGFCSAATIVRICKKNGFSGYKDLKRALQNELLFSDQLVQAQLDPKRRESVEAVITDVLNENIQAIQNTYALLDLRELDEIVRKLQQAPYLVLFGIGASFLVAKDLQSKFERVNKKTTLYEDTHMQLVASNNVAEKEIAIIVSYSGMTREMLEVARNVKTHGGIVIAITQYGSNTLIRLADYHLFVPKIEASLRISASSSRISQMAISDILFHTYMHYEKESSMDKIITTQKMLEKEAAEDDVTNPESEDSQAE